MKFLIVDDDRLCRVLVEGMLSPYGKCHTAYDGNEAINAFRLAVEDREPYDLVCLDIMMPNMDGHQVLEAIRDVERHHGIGGSDGVKVIMTTALEDSKHCMRAFREGCEAYVTKPVDEKLLLERVGELLGGLPEPRPPEEVAAETPPPPPLPAAMLAGAEISARMASGQGRFLIVDDDGVCRELLRVMLSSFGQCDLAYSGREAVEAVRLALEDGRPYDMICLDIMMPGMSGHETLMAIRELEKKRGRLGSDGVKVIMTTALCDAKHCIQAFREGCESYLTKPVHQAQLLEQMRDLDVL